MKNDWRNYAIVIGLIALALLWKANHSYWKEPNSQANAKKIAKIVKMAAKAVQNTQKTAVLLQPNFYSNTGESSSYFGGVPSRFEGESWPINRATGRPLTFVAQISKSDANKELMGNVELLRLFLDYDSNMIYDPKTDDVTILITESGDSRRRVTWEPETLNQLRTQVTAIDHVQLIHERYDLSESLIITADNSTLLKASKLIDVDNFELWWDIRVNAIKDLRRLEPNLIFPENKNVIGGNPYWIQGEETEQYPFFLQLFPDASLGIGDGGHIYIFLDKHTPNRGLSFTIQMY